jgi:D-threo-aldose 1-dehydrogenase
MRSVRLSGTDIVTTALGFGCAGVYRLPHSRDRRAVLEAAYDAGIRHYDVAPMYGFGRAEAELAPFLKRRRDEITVTTKFGIEPTAIGRGVGRVQGPVRSVLAALPQLGEELKSAGRGPGSGPIGRLLYASTGYGARSAAAGIEQSLRALGTSYIDVFALHDPVGRLVSEAPDLVAYLNGQRDLGRIRCWGIAGELMESDGAMHELLQLAPFLQFRDDIFDTPQRFGSSTGRATATFGSLRRALPALRRYFLDFPSGREAWRDRFGFDILDGNGLTALLIREALRRNLDGPVLFTSTRPGRVDAAAEAISERGGTSDADEARAMKEFAATVQSSYPELNHAS